MMFAVPWLAAVIVFVALIWVAQRRLIYFPSDDLPAPASLGLAGVEPVRFVAPDGVPLDAWFFPGHGGPPAITVLVFNGNAGNRAHRTPLAESLRKHGLQVLLMDYRGYGGNPGRPSEEGLAEDARAARTYLVGRPDVDPSRLVYFGESLGAAVAVTLASEHPPAALVLRSPFTSLGDVGRVHYPWLPVGLLLRDRFASIDRIGRVQAPVLVIAGDRDAIVPVGQSRWLYEAAPDPKALVVLPGADHNDLELLAGEEMIRAIVRFLERSRPGG
jgi:fermentation-respiration switch protein FrsA (DUF1100 family)